MATTKSQPAIPVLPNGEAEHNACWSCGDMRAAQFCQSCGSVQPPAPTDYFSFFGLPRTLNLDTGLLERLMFSLSRRLHPDLYARASEQQRTWSLEQTSKLNDAYRTLRDPGLRTEYLLRIEGLRINERSSNATGETATGGQTRRAAPPELLEEVFDVNIQLEEFRHGDATVRPALQQAKQQLETKLDAAGSELQACWDTWDGLMARCQRERNVSSEERSRVLQQMLGVLYRRRYLDHLIREIQTALAE